MYKHMPIGGYNRPNTPALSRADANQLMALSQQGNQNLTHAQLLEMQSAQRGMREVAQKTNIEVPKVNFYPSTHPDSRKARKQDIKQARRLLTPTKRHILNPLRWVWGMKYKFNKRASQCVIDGCDVEDLIVYDNLYTKITDEDTGKSLWDMYWVNPITNVPEAFVARDGISDGRRMKGTYCPEHLHLYHLYCRWEDDMEKERGKTKRGMKDLLKKGVSTVAIPVAIIKKKDNTPEMLQKYEPFFEMLDRDSKTTKGISLLHYKNPENKLNDITMVVFDLRMFQKEIIQQETGLSDAVGPMGIASPMVGGLSVSHDEGLSMVQNNDGSVSIQLPEQ